MNGNVANPIDYIASLWYLTGKRAKLAVHNGAERTTNAKVRNRLNIKQNNYGICEGENPSQDQ